LNQHWIAGSHVKMEQTLLYDHPSLYDRIIRPGPCEAFYLKLSRQVGGEILELACGTGRLTLPLALEGQSVVGVDTSSAMLEMAAAKVASENVQVRLVQGDIRTFEFMKRFRLIIVSCNSLAHLTTHEDLEDGLANIKRHLAPGGLFAFDIVNPRLEVLARPETDSVRLDVGPNPSSCIAVEEVAYYDSISQIRTATWRVPDGASGGRELAPLRLRLIFPQELLLLLKAAGLELRARFGDFSGHPLTGASLNQVCIAGARDDR
jgi:SAM-dependent methyltransferase